jgi:glycosyltransferase involved in cell wall biosynthesis
VQQKDLQIECSAAAVTNALVRRGMDKSHTLDTTDGIFTLKTISCQIFKYNTINMQHVSLVMAVYNTEKYLAEAIQSVIDQTYPYWELIIIDSNSTDNSFNIATQFAKLDNRIILVKINIKDQSQSLHMATRLSNYEYFGWIDDEDILLPTCLENTVEILNNNLDIGVVYTNCNLIDRNGNVLGTAKNSSIPYSAERLLVDFMTFHFRLIRKSIYNLIPNNKYNTCPISASPICTQDYDMCLKLSEITGFYHLDKVLYCNRVHNLDNQKLNSSFIYERTVNIINDALVRRGLSDRYRLNVSPDGRFKIEESITNS